MRQNGFDLPTIQDLLICETSIQQVGSYRSSRAHVLGRNIPLQPLPWIIPKSRKSFETKHNRIERLDHWTRLRRKLSRLRILVSHVYFGRLVPCPDISRNITAVCTSMSVRIFLIPSNLAYLVDV